MEVIAIDDAQYLARHVAMIIGRSMQGLAEALGVRWTHLNVFVLLHQRGVNAQKSVKLLPGIFDLAVRMQ